MECQHCHQTTNETTTLCEACEHRFFTRLIQLAADLEPLHDSLDATLHPGGHQPSRIQPATPPTPLRLDVLDLLDLIDTTAYELAHRLDGVDADLDATDARPEDLRMTLVQCAGHPRLALFPDAGMYLRAVDRLAAQADRLLDPPDQRREIGTCETCLTMLTAGPADQWVTCPVCDHEQRVHTVKLRRLERLCFDGSRTGTPRQIATAFSDAGLPLRRNTVSQWIRRGRLETVAETGLVAYCDVYRLVIAGVSRLD